MRGYRKWAQASASNRKRLFPRLKKDFSGITQHCCTATGVPGQDRTCNRKKRQMLCGKKRLWGRFRWPADPYTVASLFFTYRQVDKTAGAGLTRFRFLGFLKKQHQKYLLFKTVPR